ncbi:hypothetical protein, partial [Paenibacillus alginolyticus]|uniref:hypothetical protein n=1 Tax=Paenibacillus alginolyticus TaxID=59839 RepID=UPI002DB70C86
ATDRARLAAGKLAAIAVARHADAAIVPSVELAAAHLAVIALEHAAERRVATDPARLAAGNPADPAAVHHAVAIAAESAKKRSAFHASLYRITRTL